MYCKPISTKLILPDGTKFPLMPYLCIANKDDNPSTCHFCSPNVSLDIILILRFFRSSTGCWHTERNICSGPNQTNPALNLNKCIPGSTPHIHCQVSGPWFCCWGLLQLSYMQQPSAMARCVFAVSWVGALQDCSTACWYFPSHGLQGNFVSGSLIIRKHQQGMLHWGSRQIFIMDTLASRANGLPFHRDAEYVLSVGG